MQIEKTRKGRIFVAVVTVVMTLAVLVSQTNAFAGSSVDTDRECSITIQIGDEWADLKSVEIPVRLYQVAAISQRGSFTVNSDFPDLQEQLDEISDVTTAADWAAMAETAKADVDGNEELLASEPALVMENGKGSITGLATGLYLIWAEDVSTDDYDYKFTPYLISLPNTASDMELTTDNRPGADTSDEWIYDIEVSLKPERSERMGELEITKSLSTYNVSLGTPLFVFEINAVKDDEVVYNDVVSLAFDGKDSKSIVIKDIPSGSHVTVTEIYAGASYKTTSASSVELTIRADEMVEAEFTNDYDDRLVYGTGVVNHFAYDGMGFAWEQLEDNE